MSEFYTTGPYRLICTVLDEMRKTYETRNFSYLLGQIEEAQVLANKMEAKLYLNKDIVRAEEYIDELKKEIKDLQEKVKKLKEETDTDKEEEKRIVSKRFD